MSGSDRPEDDHDDAVDQGPTEAVPPGSGKQYGDDVADVEETSDPDRDEGKGFARGTPPEPTPGPEDHPKR